MTTIIVTQENNELDEYDFDVEIKTITIGRRSTNDVCIPHLSVSGNHAKITISSSGSLVEDMSSTNGTYINGRLISRQLLNDGDDIVIGKARVTFLQPERNSLDSDDSFIAADELPQQDIDDGVIEEEEEAPLTLAEKAALHRQQHNVDTGRSLKGSSKAAPRINSDDESIVEFDGSSADNYDDVATRSRKAVQAKANTLNTPASARSMRSEETPSSSIKSSIAADYSNQPGTPSALLDDAMADQSLEHELDSDNEINSGAVIEIKNGAKSGQVLPIDKPVTTLGRPGIQIAAIMKKPEGYFLMHIESENNVDRPRLNDDSIGDDPVLLSSGDSLNVAGIDVQFMLS